MNNGSFGNMLYGEIEREIIDLTKEGEEIVIEPSGEEKVYLPSENKQFSKVTAKGVTADIDKNIKPENIKLGVNILGIEGNVAPDKPDQEKTIYPSEEEQIVVADIGYELGKVIAKPIETKMIEILPTKESQSIKANDGKYIKEVEVLGVETEELNIIPTTEAQTFTPSENKFFDRVNVDAVENLDTELTDQETMLNELEAQVNELSDKPTDMLQQRVDATNSCDYLFYKYGGTNLDFIRGLDTSNVTDMTSMFDTCNRLENLNISHLDTGKVTNMKTMFQNCAMITSLDLSSFNTSNVTNMQMMFYACQKLYDINLNNFDTSKVTNMEQMFSACYLLRTISGKLDMINVTNNTHMFMMVGITDVTLLNIKKSLQLGSGTSWGTKLSNSTLINTIQQLWDLTGSTSQTLTLSTTSKNNIANIYVKLVDVTDEMLAQDQYAGSKKPCVVCESTDEGAMTLTEYATSKNWAIA